MLKILQGGFSSMLTENSQQYKLGFQRGRGTRDQIAIIHWIIEKAEIPEKKKKICFIDYAQAFDCVDHNKLKNSFWKRWEYQTTYLPPEKPVCKSRSTS